MTLPGTKSIWKPQCLNLPWPTACPRARSREQRASLLGSDQPGWWSRDQPRGLRAVIAAHGAASPQLFGDPWFLQALPWLGTNTKQRREVARDGSDGCHHLCAKPFAPCPRCQPCADISNLPREPSLPIRSPPSPDVAGCGHPPPHC